jgi:hypothetical protein
LCDSHILPEWVYQPLYDEKHRLQVLSLLPELPNQFKQKGIREKLLCEACEQMFSDWEGYARSVFVSPKTPLSWTRPSESLIHVTNLDYRKMKLFELSVLWRAGVSKLPFFEQVNLGQRHEEKLRDLLVRADPGDPDDYGAVLFGLKVGESADTLKVLSQPRPQRNQGAHGYVMMFAGFLWHFHVTSHKLSQLLLEATLRADGSRFISVQNALQMQSLAAFAKKLAEMGRVPADRIGKR